MMKGDILEVLDSLRLQGKQMLELIESSEAQAVRIRKRVEALEKQTVRDTRNWRCFIGSHQWELHSQSEWSEHINGKTIEQGPMFILKCIHCGKLKAECL